jgi:broad specificity phosphatase PhoE
MGEIYLIRHGQASFGLGDYDNLSEEGVEQSRALGSALKARVGRVDAVVCGSMRRHLQTAERCLLEMGLKADPSFDPGWNEYDHEEIIRVYEPRYRDKAALVGDLARSENPVRAFGSMFVKAMARWVESGNDGGYTEPWPVFCARVESALQRLSDSRGRTFVFTSGGPISVVCRKIFGLSDVKTMKLNGNLSNTGITRLITAGGKFHLTTLNEHCHLPETPGGV